MAKPGSSYRKMQAVRKRHQKKTDAFMKKVYKLLTVMCIYTALMFKYLFLAFWWLTKQLFKLMYTILLYIHLGIIWVVKKVFEKSRRKEQDEE